MTVHLQTLKREQSTLTPKSILSNIVYILRTYRDKIRQLPNQKITFALSFSSYEIENDEG